MSAYVCECETEERETYLILDHDGGVSRAVYCPDCAELARIDWNGTTGGIMPLDALPQALEVLVGLGELSPLVLSRPRQTRAVLAMAIECYHDAHGAEVSR